MKKNKELTSRRRSGPIFKGILIFLLILSIYSLICYYFYRLGIQIMVYSFAATTAILALFKELALSYILRPELHLKLRCAEPDCHKTRFGTHETHYFRLRVVNNGARAAEDVEVSIESVNIAQNGSYRQDTNYVPIHLLWSLWRLKISSINIPGGAYRFCDFGFVLHPSVPKFRIDTGQVCPKGSNEQLLFWFDSRFRLNAGTINLLPGRYQIEISAFSKNVLKTTLRLKIDWHGNWEENTKDMLENQIIFS
jgi:hypothetical protein